MDQKVVNLIKIWGVIVAVLSLSNLLTLEVYPISSGPGLFALIAFLLGLAVAFAAFQLNSMSLSTVAGIFWAKLIWLVLTFLFSLSPRYFNITRLLILVVDGAIVWYLIMELKKLSHSHPGSSAGQARA